MGGHSISVADVDVDGRDEIVYQAMVVDDDGRGLYSTGLRHGDAMHVADIDPERAGLEVFTVQENEEHAEEFQTPGAAMRDARTGEIIWSHSPAVDVRAGMAADIDPRHRGYEVWDTTGDLRDCGGRIIGSAPREDWWCLWWDGDPLRELFTASWRRGPRIIKWNWNEGREEPIFEIDARTAGRGPCLVADLVGDWREELLLVAPDGRSLRLYTTTIPTQVRLPTLMHDPQYRLGIASQNVTYNRPAHPSFYLGDGMNARSDRHPEQSE
jgi:rhamnogalacturonan endolyase